MWRRFQFCEGCHLLIGSDDKGAGRSLRGDEVGGFGLPGAVAISDGGVQWVVQASVYCLSGSAL
jgi:hypothetical protein